MTVLVGIINIAFGVCGREPCSSRNGHGITSFGHLLAQFSWKRDSFTINREALVYIRKLKYKEVLCHGQGHTEKAAMQISCPLHCDFMSPGALHDPLWSWILAWSILFCTVKSFSSPDLTVILKGNVNCIAQPQSSEVWFMVIPPRTWENF